MDPFSLTWITTIVFVLLAFWGMNVPTTRRSIVLVWVSAAFIIANLVVQSYIFRGTEAALTPGNASSTIKLEQAQTFLNTMALFPGSLTLSEPSAWYRIIASSFLHFSWIHLLVNIWFLVLFGHVLEQTWGRAKLLLLIAAGLILPPALDGFFGATQTSTGGMGGVVYVVMGAYLVAFPRSRCYGAVNYDLRFWAAIMFIMLPVTMVTRYAGMTLTEPVLLAGTLGIFLLIQPEHARISIAAGIVVLYKVLLDWLLIQPIVYQVAGYSVYRTLGAFAIGAVISLVFTRGRGWKQTWEDETKALPKSSRTSGRMSLAQLEAAGQNDEDAARLFLGQRVFVGDSARATAFYRDVVIPKFPNLVLPLQEQMALARLLHFKGCDKESLHAYETLLKTHSNLPDEYWIAWLKAAELVVKLAPDRQSDARFYLDQFELGTGIIMRDRIEAANLRAALPEKISAVPPSWPATSSPQKISEIPVPEVVNYGLPDTGSSTANPHSLKLKRKRPPIDETQLDFPKSEPRTFTWSDTGETEKIRMPEIKPGKTGVAHESITAHWKPLPCVAKDKTPAKSPLDFSVKNPRIAADVEKPGGYGVEFREPKSGSAKKSGRLSKLELMRNEVSKHVPEKEDMPSRYGGLNDHPKDAPPTRIKIRLQREKEAGEKP